MVAAVAVLTACMNPGIDMPTVATPDAGDASRPVMYADGPTSAAGIPGETIGDFPRVRVLRSGSRVGVPGVAVTFIRPSTGVSRVVITDSLGVARYGAFSFGAVPGIDEVFAVAAGQSQITFIGSCKAAIVDRFDLTRVGDRPLPITYSGVGTSWEITGGHYLLRADGTFDFFYDGGMTGGGMNDRPTGRYVRSGAAIEFYIGPPLSAFYAARGGLFATGKISGDVMIVMYEDAVDYDTERYERHAP